MKELIPTTLFESETVMVINKPSGLLVHPDGKKQEYSLVDWIITNRPSMSGVGEPLVVEHKGEQVVIDRPGIVHRLDRETSGVMILAKTQESYNMLKKQFQNRTVKKEYLAIVSGWIDDRGIIETPIGRHPKDIRIWTTGRGTRGNIRPAVTRYVPQKKFSDTDGNRYTLVALFPETGRTHQLRVHMKSIQRPIIGDGLYAPKTVGMLGFNRVALHARKITFKDIHGNERVVEAPVSPDFERCMLT